MQSVNQTLHTLFSAPPLPESEKDHIEIKYHEDTFSKVKRVLREVLTWVIYIFTCCSFDFRTSSVGVDLSLFSPFGEKVHTTFNFVPEIDKYFDNSVRRVFRDSTTVYDVMGKLWLNKQANLSALDRIRWDKARQEGFPNRIYKAIQERCANACADFMKKANEKGLKHIEYRFVLSDNLDENGNQIAVLEMIAPLSTSEDDLPDLRDQSLSEFGLKVGKWMKKEEGYILQAQVNWREGTAFQKAIELVENFFIKYPLHGTSRDVWVRALGALDQYSDVEGSEAFISEKRRVYKILLGQP